MKSDNTFEGEDSGAVLIGAAQKNLFYLYPRPRGLLYKNEAFNEEGVIRISSFSAEQPARAFDRSV
jgi:hypothetical protein